MADIEQVNEAVDLIGKKDMKDMEANRRDLIECEWKLIRQ